KPTVPLVVLDAGFFLKPPPAEDRASVRLGGPPDFRENVFFVHGRPTASPGRTERTRRSSDNVAVGLGIRRGPSAQRSPVLPRPAFFAGRGWRTVAFSPLRPPLL